MRAGHLAMPLPLKKIPTLTLHNNGRQKVFTQLRLQGELQLGYIIRRLVLISLFLQSKQINKNAIGSFHNQKGSELSFRAHPKDSTFDFLVSPLGQWFSAFTEGKMLSVKPPELFSAA